MRLSRLPRSFSVLALASVVACAAPAADDAGGSADALAHDESAAAALAGRYVPDDDGSNPVFLDIGLPRETPRQAAVVGRLRVAPSNDGDMTNLEKTCAITFSGVLDKPNEDGPVDVDVEVAGVTGTSPGKLRFGHVRTIAGVATSKQRVSLRLERPSSACELALGPRGDVKEGITFVWRQPLRNGTFSFATLARPVRILGDYSHRSAAFGHGEYGMVAGEPVAVLGTSRDGVIVHGTRVGSHGELEALGSFTPTVTLDALVPQPRQVQTLLAMPVR